MQERQDVKAGKASESEKVSEHEDYWTEKVLNLGVAVKKRSRLILHSSTFIDCSCYFFMHLSDLLSSVLTHLW